MTQPIHSESTFARLIEPARASEAQDTSCNEYQIFYALKYIYVNQDEIVHFEVLDENGVKIYFRGQEVHHFRYFPPIGLQQSLFTLPLTKGMNGIFIKLENFFGSGHLRIEALKKSDAPKC